VEVKLGSLLLLLYDTNAITAVGSNGGLHAGVYVVRTASNRITSFVLAGTRSVAILYFKKNFPGSLNLLLWFSGSTAHGMRLTSFESVTQR
jgi:hypothetical protein